MNKAFNFLIIAAVILGGVCIFLITKYVDARVTAARESAPIRDVVPIDVLVAKEDIEIGSKFTTFNTQLRAMPQEFVPASAVKSLADLEGQVALFTIPKEDMILTSKAGKPEQLPRASTIIEAGQRLVTIDVSETTASGFTIKNGDIVDLAGTYSITPDLLEREEMPLGGVLTVTFLQKVKVFDIIHGDESGATKEEGQNEEGGGRRYARGTTATFLVSPAEAEIILSAKSAAQELFMILRRYDDAETYQQPSGLHERVYKRIVGDLEKAVVESKPVEAPVAPPTKKVVF